MQVWKYRLQPDSTGLEMPQGTQLLHVALQEGEPTLWVLAEPTNPIVKRHISIVPTGHDFRPGKYVGTFQLYNGRLVFHVFDDGEQ